jgi:hypothetical protein
MEPAEAFDDPIQLVFVHEFLPYVEIFRALREVGRAGAWVKGQQALLGPGLQGLTRDSPLSGCLIHRYLSHRASPPSFVKDNFLCITFLDYTSPLDLDARSYVSLLFYLWLPTIFCHRCSAV